MSFLIHFYKDRISLSIPKKLYNIVYITNNVGDFENATVPVITPEAFVRFMEGK